MGADDEKRGRRSPAGPLYRGDRPGGSQLTTIAQVVPDVPSFAVDDGFAYLVPDDVSGVVVGSLVRIPLGGRRVRGFVTGVRAGEPDRALKAILAISGDLPVFDRRLLETARWVATHYVAPLSTVLARCAPPNVPRSTGTAVRQAAGPHRHQRTAYTITGDPPASIVAEVVAPIVDGGEPVMVTAPTVVEAASLSADLASLVDGRVAAATSAESAAERTEIWAAMAVGEPMVVVGTREVAFWGAGSMGGAVMVEEGRRAYKAKPTPTFNVREVLRRRSVIERFSLRFVGPVPTTESYAAGVEMVAATGRVWPLVELVDRRADGGSLILDHTRRAIGSTLRSGGRVFVLANRRGYAAAFRCVRCHELRRCTNCGSGLDSGTCRRCGTEHDACPHCGGKRFAPLGAGIGRVVDDLRRSFGDAVGNVDQETPIRVGTERDLVGLIPGDLSVAVDADSMLLAPNYRAGEDTLRILVRTTLTTTPGRGRKAMVQTAIPDHPALAALRVGRPLPFVESEIAVRSASGLPPVGELIALTTNAPAEAAGDAIEAAVGDAGSTIGPASIDDGHRWLIQGSALAGVRISLRSTVQGLRNDGWRVRVDADPVDL